MHEILLFVHRMWKFRAKSKMAANFGRFYQLNAEKLKFQTVLHTRMIHAEFQVPKKFDEFCTVKFSVHKA